MNQSTNELIECTGCGDLYLEGELHHSDDYLDDGSGRGGKIIDPTCIHCIEGRREERAAI